MMSNLSKEIIKFRNLGYSYTQICEKLNCSKSTVAYWCNDTEKDNVKRRKLKIEPWVRQLISNISKFKARKVSKLNRKSNDWNMKLRSAVKDFCKRSNMKNWGHKELISKFGTKTKCYLTGKDIDITTDDYNLDHIVPICKGGTGDLDNVGITIPNANASKSGMTLEEYLQLCEDVLRYHKPELFK